MSDTNYYYGHGEGWLGVRNSSGIVTDFDIPLPEMDELSLSFATEKVEHTSKRQSLSAKDLSVVSMMSGNGKMVCSVHSTDLLKVYLFGTTATVVGGAFIAANAIFPTGVSVGDRLPIPGGRKNISSLVIKDSAGSPATLTLNTHYQIEDADAGIIKFLNLAAFTQPFTAAGAEGAGSAVGLLTQRVYERYLRFKGINLADGDKSCIIDLYKIQIEPAKEWTLLSSGNEPNKYEIGFELLKDTTKAISATLGQYGDYKEASAGLDIA